MESLAWLATARAAATACDDKLVAGDLAAADVPREWRENSTVGSGTIRQQVNAFRAAVPAAERSDVRMRCGLAILVENDATGTESTPAAVNAAAKVLQTLSVKSLEDLVDIYADRVEITQLGGPELSTFMKISNAKKEKKSAETASGKKPSQRVNVDERLRDLGLADVDATVKVSQQEVDDFLRHCDKNDSAVPYVVLAVDPWSPKGAGWENQLEVFCGCGGRTEEDDRESRIMYSDLMLFD